MKRRTINLVGVGKVAHTLALLWQHSGVYDIQAAWNRHGDAQAIQALHAQWPAMHCCARLADLPHADVVAIGVRDDAIETVAQALAQVEVIQATTTVLHFSGAKSSRSLSALHHRTVRLGSLHPVFAFADADLAFASLPGHLCALESTASAQTDLQSLANAAGLRAFSVDVEQKVRYHAAMSVSANFLVTLNHYARQLLAPLALPDHLAAQLVNQLMQQNLVQLQQYSPEMALTGPIARSDAETVAAHWQALSAQEQPLYQALARETMRLANLSAETQHRLAAIMAQNGKMHI